MMKKISAVLLTGWFCLFLASSRSAMSGSESQSEVMKWVNGK